MKNKKLLISTIVYFLIVHTSYYWESKLGMLGLPVFLFLALVFLVLLVSLVTQLFYLIFEERFKNRQRIVMVSLLAITLTLTFFYPFGVIDFDRLSGKNILVAQAEGVAGCGTILKLKDTGRFVDKTICFGVFEVKGKYEQKGDTIFFKDVKLSGGEHKYYEYALIKTIHLKDSIDLELVRFHNRQDSVGNSLEITKNELIQ